MKNFWNNRWLPIITLLLLTANIITLALLWTHKKPAEHFGAAPPPPGAQVFEFLSHELKLDSAQRATYAALRDDHRRRVRPLQDSIAKSKDSFFALLQNEKVSDSLVLLSGKKTSAFELERDTITFHHFQKLRAICNKEQQLKFDSIISIALQQINTPQGPGPRRGGARQDSFNEPMPGRPGPMPGDRRPPPPRPGADQHRPGDRSHDGPPPPGDEFPPPGDRPPPSGDMPPPQDAMRPGMPPPPPGSRMRPPGDRPPPPPFRKNHQNSMPKDSL